ncbi:unnamed protein product [Caenorhabditis brenneri]
MSSSNKPMSYDSTKILLQHLEANQRFKISRHCPSLRVTEKCVPLKIKDLQLEGKDHFTVNDHTYKWGIYFKYPEGVPILETHQKSNEKGGVQDEFDKYGVNKNHVRLTEERLAELLKEKGDGPWSYSEEQARIEALKNRRDDTLPIYQMMIQLSITSPRETTIQRFDYTIKLAEFKKKLADVLFGGRSHPIFVDKMLLKYSAAYLLRKSLRDTLRFIPRKFRIIEKDLDCWSTFIQMIDKKSLPIEYVSLLYPSWECWRSSHPVVVTAKHLIIWTYEFDEHWFTDIPKLSNQRIKFYKRDDEPDGFIRMVKCVAEYWMKNDREIGARFSIPLVYIRENRLIEPLEEIIASLNGEQVGESSYVIPTKFNKKIQVSFETDDKSDDPFGQHLRAWRMIRITVLQA